MKDVIFSFTKPNPGSTVASNRIALFLAETLRLPLVYGAAIAKEKPRTLFIVNGAFAFCDCLPELARAVLAAKRIVWVQNDYTITPPKADSGAQSPFRKAFRLRAKRGLPPVDYWTTVEKNAALTRRSRYINWNSLTYQPIWGRINPKRPMMNSLPTMSDLFYYGAFRQGRVSYFDRYFINPTVPVTISSTSPKFKRYDSGDDGVMLQEGMARKDFFPMLAEHGLGLYIEDRKSHLEFHSPANRFYEMLSAGLPMVFQPESVPMLAKAGFDVRPYVATPDTLPGLLQRAEKIGTEQRKAWAAPYVQRLRTAVKKAYRGE